MTWVDQSKLKRTIMRYNDEVRLRLCFRPRASTHSVFKLDDFDLL